MKLKKILIVIASFVIGTNPAFGMEASGLLGEVSELSLILLRVTPEEIDRRLATEGILNRQLLLVQLVPIVTQMQTSVAFLNQALSTLATGPVSID